MKRFFKFLPLLALAAARPAHADIAWTNSLSAARAQAAASNRPIFVDFYTDWCGWCKKLDAEVYTDVTVQSTAQNFVMVKLDAEGGGAADAKAFGVTGFPTLMFLAPNGQPLGKQAGYVDAVTLSNAMTRVLAQMRPAKTAPVAKAPTAAKAATPAMPNPNDWRTLPGMQAAIGQADGQVYLLDEKGPVLLDASPKAPAKKLFVKTVAPKKMAKKPAKKSAHR